MTDLGLTLYEGIQDRQGRSLVRRDSPAAVTWFRKAASHGDPTALAQLGYAYDIGSGVRPDSAQAIRWYRWAIRAGSSTAASNLATVHRDAGKPTLAFRWWNRSAAMGDGDAAVDTGYGYQYGIGVRKNAVAAKRLYRRAIESRQITQYAREAALYHLAVLYLDERRPAQAIPLLKRANQDGDYPEAAALLKQWETSSPCTPCRCKRLIRKTLRGHAKCPIHPR
jgi:TPR repeat protein